MGSILGLGTSHATGVAHPLQKKGTFQTSPKQYQLCVITLVNINTDDSSSVLPYLSSLQTKTKMSVQGRKERRNMILFIFMLVNKLDWLPKKNKFVSDILNLI